eukprot:1140536-Pelagomonas_calceolata.AAC.3
MYEDRSGAGIQAQLQPSPTQLRFGPDTSPVPCMLHPCLGWRLVRIGHADIGVQVQLLHPTPASLGSSTPKAEHLSVSTARCGERWLALSQCQASA